MVKGTGGLVLLLYKSLVDICLKLTPILSPPGLTLHGSASTVPWKRMSPPMSSVCA
ncbi:hypothetical protein F652_4175 [Enterobacteriaceae bacterium bta3-1]|nr:hypothetical protein F652_4175 [Enterobacteriaceae bacterium bta3-1]